MQKTMKNKISTMNKNTRMSSGQRQIRPRFMEWRSQYLKYQEEKDDDSF